MLWRNNGRENQNDNKGVVPEQEEAPIKEGEPVQISQGENVQKVFDDVQALKEKIEMLKAQTEKLSDATTEELVGGNVSVTPKAVETTVDQDAVKAAERAVIEHARLDARNDFMEIHQKEVDKEARIREAAEREAEAKARLAQKQKEAEEKQRALKEAERAAAESRSRRQQIEMQSEANQTELLEERRKAVERSEKESRKLKDIEKKIEREKREVEKRAAAELKKEQERIAREKAAEEKRLAAEAKKKAEAERKRLAEEKKKLKEEERLAAITKKNEAARAKLEAQREAHIEAQRQKEERAREKEERARLIAEQREIQKRKREEQKAEQRRLRKIQEERKNEDKRQRKAAIKQKRAERKEIRRQQKVAKELAEKGGGIVNVHGQTVQTEIHPVPAFSLRDLLGRSKTREIKATTSEEERLRLQAESERIQAEAARTAATLAAARRTRRQSSPFVEKLYNFLTFCDEKKKPLLIAFSIILVFAVGTAAVFNYCTAYEYSYNGNQLGYVKNKDDVLQITGMVQSALSEEKNVDIVIDARDDIQFKRVYTMNKDIMIDSSDDVLKRLTYLNKINVKAFGIFIDGKKVGAVKDKETAAAVFEDIKDKYASNKKGAEIEEAVVIEQIDTRKSNTPLEDVLSEKQMVDRLCTDSVKEIVYTVERGETLADIAKVHNVDLKDLKKDNPNVDPDKLVVGSTIIIHETAPLMTVQITEKRTYVEKTPYETIKKKDKDLYEGYTEVDQKGRKGLSELTDRTVSINGTVVETKNLENKVEEKPVDKIVRVGTKERPPTVGSGTYIWPANPGTYVVTSEFKWRWGRQHQGIDMGCSTGNDVLAADGGTVVHAGWMGGYGNLVIIDHQNGVQTYYGHNSSLCVKVGDKVFQGQHIAEAGNTGNSFGSHIHFGVMDHGEFKNPRNYLP